MSTTTKGAVLRIILPRTKSENLLAQLGSSQRLERREILLSPGRLTTEEIAKYIREFAKLRDETLHTIRLLGAPRKARNNVEPMKDPGGKLDEYWKQLDRIRDQYRESQSRIEKLEREIEDAKKTIGLINQILETGFAIHDVRTSGLGFNKILGRITTRKLQEFLLLASERMNQLADISQEALIFLRAVLRMGEDTTAEHAFTVLEKNPSNKVLEALTRSGALIEAE